MSLRIRSIAVAACAALAACGDVSSNPSPTTFSIGGTVSGLAGSGLVLSNGGENLLVTSNGTFTFVSRVASGTAYAVTVRSQPENPTQTCTVSNGTGTVASANVNSVVVSCVTYRNLGGAVSGLAGSGLVLQSGTGQELAVTANGSFTFPAPLTSGTAYAVTVKTQPSSPSQTCTVANGTGVMGNADVANVAVSCAVNGYALGGTVGGLAGSGLVLQSGTGQEVAVSASGAFAFANPIPSGTAYQVAVKTQPSNPTQVCTVAGGSGTIGASDVGNVVVTCALSAYSVGGTLSGLAAGVTVVLRNNGGDDLALSADGAFTFPAPVASGAAYLVTVATQPTTPVAQNCVVTGGSGTIGSQDVTSVQVACTTATFTVGGVVAGLAAGNTVVLRNNGGDDLQVSANGSFTFTTRVASGGAYAVTVATNPATPVAQTCTVTSGSGTVGAANVTSVQVACVTRTFAVGGAVTNLKGAIVLQNNGGDATTVAANATRYTFTTPVASGATYAATVLTQPSSPQQNCSIANATGTVGSADVTNVNLSCVTATYTVGGTVSGLVGSGLTLRTSGATDAVVAVGATSFTFSPALDSGTAYAVTVAQQPTHPAQTCTVASGSGTIGSANVTDVAVTCAAPATSQIQLWTPPAAWGGNASGVWADSPTMRQHLIVDSLGAVESKLPTGSWTAGATGAPPVSSTNAIAYPEVQRFGVGPFASGALPQHLYYSGDASAVDLADDMIVCAVVKPDYDPLTASDVERVIVAKGKQESSGWVLMQMHGAFCFHYQVGPTSADWVMAYTDTYFDDFGIPNTGPLNDSYAVVCGGRDAASGKILVAANSFEPSVAYWDVSPATSMYVSPTANPPMTIGGYADGSPTHIFKGKVYETAVWAERATPEAVQAKMAAVTGMTLPGGGVANYVHNREAPFARAAGATPPADPAAGTYRTAWRHAPRIYPGKGFLFGLQGTNRVMFPEDLSSNPPPPLAGAVDYRWVASGGAVVAPYDALPPNDSALYSASRLNLPPGANVSANLANFAYSSTGKDFVEGQIWIRPNAPNATGTLRIRSDLGATSLGSLDINLSAYPAGQWSRVRVTGIRAGTTLASTTPARIYLENPAGAASSIDVHAWGVALMQIGRGNDIGFDPGFTMYDTLRDSSDMEYILMPTVADTTAATGFCLAADAAPYDTMAWSAPFDRKRVAMSWNDPTLTKSVQLYADATNVCARIVNGADGADLCGPASGGWGNGTSHKLRTCITPAGAVSIYADDVQVGSGTLSFAVPNLQGGRIWVGEGDSGTWQGYIKRAKVCRPAADCN